LARDIGQSKKFDNAPESALLRMIHGRHRVEQFANRSGIMAQVADSGVLSRTKWDDLPTFSGRLQIFGKKS